MCCVSLVSDLPRKVKPREREFILLFQDNKTRKRVYVFFLSDQGYFFLSCRNKARLPAFGTPPKPRLPGALRFRPFRPQGPGLLLLVLTHRSGRHFSQAPAARAGRRKSPSRESPSKDSRERSRTKRRPAGKGDEVLKKPRGPCPATARGLFTLNTKSCFLQQVDRTPAGKTIFPRTP